MEITIKAISLEDLEAFFEFFQKTVTVEFPEYSADDKEFILNQGWSKSVYGDWIKNNLRLILGAWQGDKIVGVLDAGLPMGGVCFCNWLMVDRLMQRKGIGTKLLLKLEEMMKEKGAHMIYLYSSEKNNPYYEKIDYELIGNMKKSWFGQDHHLFTKQI